MVHKFASPLSDLRDLSHSSHRRWGSPHRRDSGPEREDGREGGREHIHGTQFRGGELKCTPCTLSLAVKTTEISCPGWDHELYLLSCLCSQQVWLTSVLSTWIQPGQGLTRGNTLGFPILELGHPCYLAINVPDCAWSTNFRLC